MSISFPVGLTATEILEAVDIRGNTINLTGASVVCLTVYRRPREGSAFVKQYTLVSGIELTDGDNGLFKVTFVGNDLSEGEYAFDAYAILADSTQTPIGRGEIDVTRFDTLEP